MASPGSWSTHDTLLIACAASAVVGIVVLITVARLHPFLALILGSAWVGLTAGLSPDATLSAFQKGVGETLGGVGVVLALGTMLGKLLAASGGADRIVSAILDRTGTRRLPWAMALAAMLVGIPMFFEVGLVLLMPVILLVARRSGGSVLRVGIPALAALSVCHGLIPPHPGPLIAAGALHADIGRTLAYGVLVALPTVALAGPVFGTWIARRMNPEPPLALVEQLSHTAPGCGQPGFGIALATVLLPVALMLVRTSVELAGFGGTAGRVAASLGHPIAAMVISVLVAMVTLGRARGIGLRAMSGLLGESLAPLASMILVIGAGGGFKQSLVESGIGAAIGRASLSANVPPIFLGWLLAVAIRVATGSATVATVTASGIMAPIMPTLHAVPAPLLALSIGAGSLFFSHVNDAGFWLVKEYFGMSVGQTLRSWSTMETIISLVALGLIALLGWMA